MRISRRTEIYAKAAVSDPYTIYFYQEMKEDDATHFLKAAHKEFADYLSKEIFELIPRSIVTEVENLFPVVWSMNWKK